MNLDRVDSGQDVPNNVNVVIEIPMNSDPIKYELDKETGALFIDRFMSTAMHYPCNYGYIPHTLSDDGDPVDVLVLTPYALIPGVVVRCRPIGMLKMTDEAGGDEKLLAVPIDKLTPILLKLPTFLSITKIWSQANGSRLKAGSDPKTPRKQFWRAWKNISQHPINHITSLRLR
jgi:inorganic pyrophosphatase